MERVCTKCGNPIDDGDLFCDICGAKFEDDAAIDTKASAETEKSDEAVEETPKESEKKTDPAGFVSKHKEQVIFVAIALAVIIAALVIVNIIAANTPEAALKKAVEYRLSANVNGSVSIDYESNFSKTESKSDALARMKGNADLTTKRTTPVKIEITSETRVLNDKTANSTELTDRINDLSANYKDTEKITDIRNLSYSLIDGDDVKMSGTAQAIKVGGKWYIYGVAQTALAF